MPIYEFECKKCRSKFELLIRSDKDKAVCPKCNSTSLKRLISSFAFSSKDSSGNITASSGCGGCASHDCSSCSR